MSFLPKYDVDSASKVEPVTAPEIIESTNFALPLISESLNYDSIIEIFSEPLF